MKSVPAVSLGALLALLLAFACSSEDNGRARVSNTPYDPNYQPTGTATGTSTGASGGSTSAFATIDFSTGAPFRIFSYEASLSGAAAVSVKGSQPAVSIDFETAKAACVAAGARLCKFSEWEIACEGATKLKYAYAATETGPPALASTCDVARTTNNTPGSLPSAAGSHPDCKTKDLELYDMVGNVAEWTTDDASGSAVAAGAAFYQDVAGSSCETTLSLTTTAMNPTEKSTDLGFRCCYDGLAGGAVATSTVAGSATDTGTGTSTALKLDD